MAQTCLHQHGWNCRHCVYHNTFASTFCLRCKRSKTTYWFTLRTVCLLLMLAVAMPGCVHHKKKKKHAPVHDNEVTATSIFKESAHKRAQVYNQLAEKIDDGEVTTVQQCFEFSSPLFEKVNDGYTEEINVLREKRLNGADDKLPDDAADVFRKFAKEYDAASK